MVSPLNLEAGSVKITNNSMADHYSINFPDIDDSRSVNQLSCLQSERITAQSELSPDKAEMRTIELDSLGIFSQSPSHALLQGQSSSPQSRAQQLLQLLTKYNQELYRILEMREKIDEMQDQQCVLIIAAEKQLTIVNRNAKLRLLLQNEEHEQSIVEQQNDQLIALFNHYFN